MISLLGIEEIGADHCHRSGDRMSGRDWNRYYMRPRPWVALIHGGVGFLAREFLSAKRDYVNANSTGSRGVIRWYEIDEGSVVEVNAPISWRKADRYFARAVRGQLTRIGREEVDAWIAKAT